MWVYANLLALANDIYAPRLSFGTSCGLFKSWFIAHNIYKKQIGNHVSCKPLEIQQCSSKVSMGLHVENCGRYRSASTEESAQYIRLLRKTNFYDGKQHDNRSLKL